MLFLIAFSMFGFLSVAVGASPCAGAAVLPGADGASPGCRAAVPGHNRRMGCDRRTRNTREHEQRPSALGSRVAARLRSRWVPVPRGRAGAGPAPARAARPRPRLKEFFLCAKLTHVLMRSSLFQRAGLFLLTALIAAPLQHLVMHL